MKSKLLIILFSLLLLISCKFNEDESENDQTNSDSANVYTTINAIFNTEDSLPKKSISVSIIGKDARQIFDSEGKTNFRVKNGELDLLLSPGVNPTDENPITFSILAYMEGYSPLKQEVVVNINTKKISVNCIFKKPVALNKEQKKDAALIDKNKVDKKVISNSDVVSTKSKVQKPSNTNELKKEIIPVEKKQVKVETNVNASSTKTEVQKPTIIPKIKKEVNLVEDKKFNTEAKVILSSPKPIVQKPNITPKPIKDIVPVEKKPVNTQTNLSFSSTKNEIPIPTITPKIKKEIIPVEKKESNTETKLTSNLFKIDAQKTTTTEIKKDLIAEKKEIIKTDTLELIGKSITVLPKFEAQQLIITELKKDSINKIKRRSKTKSLALISKIKSDTSKIEKQNDNLNAANKDSIKFDKKNLAISIGVGFPLYSISLNYQFSNQISARLGFLTGFYEPYYYTSFKANYTEVKGNFQVNMINLFFDYYPNSKSAFKVTFGLANSYNDYSISVTPLTNQSYGYITYTPADIGKIKTEIQVNSLMPYLGIGLGKAVPTNRLGLGLDLGFYYQGSPKFNFQSEGSFTPSDNEKNTTLFNNTFSNWVLLPSINFQVKYKLLPR